MITVVAGCGGGGSKSNNNIPDPPPDVLTGLNTRPQNSTCVAPARPDSGTTVSVANAFPGLPALSQPTKVLVEPVADPRWFVLQKPGQIVVFDPDNATSVAPLLTIDVRTMSEGGLLGMAFHPDYPAVPEVFVSYTRDHSGPAMRSVISRFILDNVTSPGTFEEQMILEVDQPFDNHNGGDIAFGADRLLYIGFGDGGSGGDPGNRAQDTSYLLGSLLRIDVIGPGVSYPTIPYVIPVTNPFSSNAKCGPGVNASACPEIYAWGFRNPWRWSFDPPTGELWVGDVGQNALEEVDRVELGGNYGWRCYEGANEFNTTGCNGNYIDPVSEYGRSDGNSITGGFVYRGSAIPGLVGRYVFADYGSGRFWALLSDGQGGYTSEEIVDTTTGPTSFGVDQDGELYYTDISTGRIMQLVAAGGSASDTIPDLLSDTGCVDPSDITQPNSGLVPYEINAPFWSDGAVKDRYMGLPDGSVITIDGDDDWDFPSGTVIVKNFRLDSQLVETRHLMRHPDGVWAGYTYEWNATETEATRVRGGKTVTVNGQDWVFPSEAQCMQCHTAAAGFSLGPETAQVNKDFTYPSTSITANQLDTLDHIMMFSSPLPATPGSLPSMPDPGDSAADLGERARAYLHTNCSQCHQPSGPTPVDIDFRYSTALANTSACDVTPQAGGLGLTNPKIIAPGDASRSVVIARTNIRDSNGMPPAGSTIPDVAGVALLSNWINGMTGCN